MKMIKIIYFLVGIQVLESVNSQGIGNLKCSSVSTVLKSGLINCRTDSSKTTAYKCKADSCKGTPYCKKCKNFENEEAQVTCTVHYFYKRPNLSICYNNNEKFTCTGGCEDFTTCKDCQKQK
ncbi:hypothetical protein BY996DRAFT_243606 [Phakopsora pachyrhizi]|uniref:Expressed protein n=1 Tax=Phakopsora pachyrhizi TaxID=170000 RepID=A0AAV0B1M2_PHAPC|nr:hypothetical protein BY996DRAFT_243606 [Phakopsora pachyrhizi]CAH7676120.1 expressed protein [Phakopsora pachyrhizi]